MIEEIRNEHWRRHLTAIFEAGAEQYSRVEGPYRAMTSWMMDQNRRLFREGESALQLPDALRMVAIAMSPDLPVASNSMDDAGSRLLTSLWILRHPSVVQVVRDGYAACPRRRRRDALALLACQRTKEAVEAIRDLVGSYGLPRCHPRFFDELCAAPELVPLIATVLVEQGEAQLPGVADVVIRALTEGTLPPRDDGLTSLAPRLDRLAAGLLEEAASAQRARAGRWRDEDDDGYGMLRAKLGASLDLVSRIPACEAKVLELAAAQPDPHIAVCAVDGVLNRSGEPDSAALERAASSAETRLELHHTLERNGRLELFPPELFTFEAFAAAAMVDWLLYPTELGYEPPEIELVHRVEGRSEDGEAGLWCVWRFTDDQGQAFAGASGPYPEAGEATDVLGAPAQCFSRFDAWDECTPDEHLERIVGNLEAWGAR